MNSKLNQYDQKRDFDKTPEPRGQVKDSAQGLRFVIQHHMARAEHYDFRLEWQGTMLSWAVPKGPSYDPHDKRLAVHVEDHPLDYRNFEGTIPQGQYGGGTVMIWDEGFWEPLVDVEEGLKKGELKFSLRGKRLVGSWVLIKWKSKSERGKDNWLLIKEKDEHVMDESGIENFDTSVRTGRSMPQITQGVTDAGQVTNPFDKAPAQLAKLVDDMPEGKGWVYEVKYDGYRIIAYIQEHTVRLMTRNGHDYAGRFPSVVTSLHALANDRAMVLDGEVAVIDETGRTDFQALQNYLKGNGNSLLTFIVFDLLALDGEDLRGLPLTERKEKLEALMAQMPAGLHFSRHMTGDEEIFRAACQADLEGIIGKKADSAYAGSRDGSWVKVKCDKRQEFVIGGYTLTDKRQDGVSALLLGYYEGKELVYAGRAGTGMGQSDMELLVPQFKKLIRKTAPFSKAPRERSGEKITWLKPQLVAEIKFAQWTDDNLLRQASYKGLRPDKDASDVVRETPQAASPDSPAKAPAKKSGGSSGGSEILGITISHPSKIVYKSPKLTKLQVARYYEQVAPAMLPYVKNRVMSVLRCPRGISQACFFLKHPGTESPHVTPIPIDEKGGDREDYFYLEDEAGIIYQAQMGTLEFHPWGSRVQRLEQPDVMVFDLDPDAGMALERIRRGVRDLKEVLDELSLTSFLKTSGGKGYHVVVPIKPGVDWEVFHDFAKNVAQVMEARWPQRYTGNIRKDSRKGKIFVDWIRNGRGATSVAPYSIRAREGAKVSMPIAWDELDQVAPDGIDMQEAVRRLKGEDPWAGFFETEQTLT